jgi:glycosyltransferase involved in cell wall biosynthesis
MAEDPAPSLEQENILAEGDPESVAFVKQQLCTGGCLRWQCGCGNCDQKREYPESWWRDQSARNWREKRSLFTSLDYLILATPSEWLKQQAGRSFLKNVPTYCLPHGIDPGVFKPCVSETERYSVLKRLKLDTCLDKHLLVSVANIWEPRKGLDDLLALSEKLGNSYCIVAVGLEDEQRAAIPDGTIIGLPEMGNLQDLCALYTAADLFVSMSHAEAAGTRLLQALCCGTQVFCWETTALPEIVTPEVGAMAPLGDLKAAAEAIRQLCDDPRSPEDCRRRALEFDAGKRLHEYVRLYERMHINGPRATVSEKVAAGC